jgi:hypothetical protein
MPADRPLQQKITAAGQIFWKFVENLFTFVALISHEIHFHHLLLLLRPRTGTGSGLDYVVNPSTYYRPPEPGSGGLFVLHHDHTKKKHRTLLLLLSPTEGPGPFRFSIANMVNGIQREKPKPFTP